MTQESDLNKLVRVLKSLGLNYPVIHAHGYRVLAPILLVVDAGQTQPAIRILAGISAPVLHESFRSKTISSIIENSNSTYVFYPYTPSTKGEQLAVFLESVVRSGEISGHELSAIPMIVAEGAPPRSLVENYFTIFLSGNLEQTEISLDEVVPNDDKIPVVADRMKCLISSEMPVTVQAFQAAACFLYPRLVEEGKINLFDEYMELAVDLAEKDENNRCFEEMSEMFLRELYLWQENTRFIAAYEVKELEGVEAMDFTRVLVFNEKFAYVSEKLFRLIVNRLCSTYSINALKQGLVETGILCPNTEKTYSVKLNYSNSKGEPCRVRMLRFARRRLRRTGDIEFVDLCLCLRGEGNA